MRSSLFVLYICWNCRRAHGNRSYFSVYLQGSSSNAWIHAIARNKALDIIHQRSRSVSIEAFDSQPLPDQLISRYAPDDRRLLVSGLNRLGHDQAIVFVLKVIVGLSHLETSRLLVTPDRLVRFRYHQAVSKLKEFLSVAVDTKLEWNDQDENAK